MTMRAPLAGITFAACALLASCVHPIAQPPPAYEAPAIEPVAQPLAPVYPSDAEVAVQETREVETPPPLHMPNGAWRAVGQPVTEPLAAGGAVRFKTQVTDGSATVSLDVVVFDSRQCRVCVLDQPDANAGGGAIANVMRSHAAVAGVNGGYFTPEFQPLGLMIASGKPTGVFSTSTLLSGVLVSTQGTPRLLWRKEYSAQAGTTDLVQGGPRLVDDSRPLPKLERGKSRARTFIATDGRHGWAIGLVKSTSLGELADLLASPRVIPILHVTRALNLDGGHSSAIWMRTAAGEEISEPGWSTVRDFIAIVPR